MKLHTNTQHSRPYTNMYVAFTQISVVRSKFRSVGEKKICKLYVAVKKIMFQTPSSHVTQFAQNSVQTVRRICDLRINMCFRNFDVF